MSKKRAIIRGPNGEVWQEPLPNSPARARPGWLTKMQMDAVNAKPIPAAALAVEPWHLPMLMPGWSGRSKRKEKLCASSRSKPDCVNPQRSPPRIVPARRGDIGARDQLREARAPSRGFPPRRTTPRRGSPASSRGKSSVRDRALVSVLLRPYALSFGESLWQHILGAWCRENKSGTQPKIRRTAGFRP